MTDDANATAADASRRPKSDPLAQRLRAAAAKMTPTMPTPSKNKRRAEDSPDDPRKDDGKAEITYDDASADVEKNDDTAMEEADRDSVSHETVEQSKSPGTGMVDSIDTNECNHCGREVASRNLLFKHLYQNHDADSQGHRLRNDHGQFRGSVGNGRACTDEIARPALQDQDAMRHRAISKPNWLPAWSSRS